MVSTETLQVIINAKDQLSSKVREINNAIKQTGTVANSSSTTATSATDRIGSAYDRLKNKVRTAFNDIKNTIRNSTTVQTINESRLAQPFLNAAEKIRNKWQNTMQQIKSAAGVLSNIRIGTGQISNAGLATLNGQIATTQTKTSMLTSTLNLVGNAVNTVGSKAITAFGNFKTGVANAASKLSTLASGMSGLQGAVMSAFSVVGVTSIKSFTIEAAIAREKVNAVTKSVTGSQQAFEKTQKSIKSAVAGTTLGYNNMATAVNNVALRFHMTGDAVSKLPGPMAKVGIMAQAMGKSSEEAAKIMESAFDGLQGKWRGLKQIGITKEDLIGAGWSGAADDVNGYAQALDKVLEKNPKFKEFTQTFEYQWESFKMSIKGVGTEIGMTLLPILKTLLSFLTDLSKQHPWLFKIAVVIGLVVLALSSIATAILPIIMLISAIKEITLVTSIWNAVLAMNPITIVVIAIIALIAALVYLYYTNEDVRNALNALWQFLSTSFIAAWQWLQATFQGLYDFIVGVFLAAWQWLCDAFTNASNAITALMDWLNWLYQTFLTVLPLILAILMPWTMIFDENIRNTAISAVQGFIAWISTLPGQLWTWLLNALQKVWNWASQIVTSFKDAALKAVNDFIAWIKTLPGKFWTWLVNTYNKVTSFKGTLVQKIKDAALQAVNGFKSKVMNLPGIMWTELMNIKNKILNAVGSLVDAIKSLGWRMLEGFKSALGINSPGLMSDNIENEMGYIKDHITNAYGGVKRAATKLGENILSGFNSTGADSLVSVIDGAEGNNQLSYTVTHEINKNNDKSEDLFKYIKEIHSYIRDIHDGNSTPAKQEVQLTQDGKINLDYNVNMENVPTGIDEKTLKEAVLRLMNDRDILKAITSSREFQDLDQKIKTRILGELSRHL